MENPAIDLKLMGSLLNYDQGSGKLLWRDSMNRGRIPAGTEVGSTYPDGYKRLNVGGKMYMAHRLGYALANKRDPSGIVDHIDGNRLNNSLANLREATAEQNAHNTQRSKRNTTGVKGVYFDKYHSKYRARVMVRGKQNHLGLFRDLEEARKAQESARSRMHGEYANTGGNVVDETNIVDENLETPPISIGSSDDSLAKASRMLGRWL